MLGEGEWAALAARAPRLGLLLGARPGAGQRSGLGCVGRALDEREIRLRRVVGVEETGLPTGEVVLVADVEEEQSDDGALAVGEGDSSSVVAALRRFRDDVPCGGAAMVRVGTELVEGNRGLDAVLAVENRQRGAWLCGAVEGNAQKPDELRIVRDRDAGRLRVQRRRRRP